MSRPGRKRSAENTRDMDALAEVVSLDTFPTLAAAGRSIGIAQSRTDQLWLTIRRRLGIAAR